MKAAIIEKFGEPLVIKQVPNPAPKADEILVKITATGVCHTDVHLWKGDWPLDKRVMEENNISILGHEGVGRITETGPGVSLLNTGDRVGVPFINYYCGRCESCLSGYANYCDDLRVTSEHVGGTYAEYATISERAAPNIPGGISDEHAAPLLCAGITAYSAIRKLITELGIPPGKRIAIVGAAGGLGHYAVQFAKAFGYRVTAVDVSRERLDFARELGADSAVDASEAAQHAKSHGRFYAVLVFTPNLGGYHLARKLVRTLGGVVVVGLPPQQEGPIDITPADMVTFGTRFVPSSVGLLHEMSEVFSLYLEGKVRTHLAEIGGLTDVNRLLTDLSASRYLARAVMKL